MNPTVDHAGRAHVLQKHPRELARHRAGQLTAEQLAAQPWYLRITVSGKRRSFQLSADDRRAMADARDLLNGQTKRPELFSQFVALRDARRGVTLGTLASDWFAAGLPHSSTKPRTTAQAARLRATLERALEFWETLPAAGVGALQIEQFAAQRGSPRSADLELASLSSLCQWAARAGRIERNPFENRAAIQDSATISHCHEHCPGNDEELHRVLQWLFEHRHNQEQLGNRYAAADIDRNQILAGGCLAFMALTGLRPGEPQHLGQHGVATEYPARLAAAPAGLIYPCPDGQRRMKVQRLKRGQNPTVILTHALADFLETWNTWLASVGRSEAGAPMFPLHPDNVRDWLARACKAVDLPVMKPHGFGRAYYVRVRRSQGASDAQIAVELGQSSNGALIRSVYGDPGDGVGGNIHDWLPKEGAPAWQHLLASIPSNLVTVRFKN